MDKGYIENGFIVDLSNAKKTSEIIYELSRILDMPEAKEKNVCLKLGEVDLNVSQLISIKALIESMDSQLEFINTSSELTKTSAESINIVIFEFKNKVEAPEFEVQDEKVQETDCELKMEGSEKFETATPLNVNNQDANCEMAQDNANTAARDSLSDNPEVNEELESALDKIFGEGDFDERYPEHEIEEEVRTEEKMESEELIEESADFEEIRKHRKENEKLPTLYVQRTLRSGQNLTSDGNIVIIGDVNPGAEIVAKGDITVWGILGGIAHAGSDGNTYSRIRALKLHAIQLRIGDVFARRPDTINIPYVQKSESFVPEEARINKKHIVIYKLHENN